MSMIPNAQTLADILNDPAIPAEAKPLWFHNWNREEPTRKWIVEPHKVYELNADLYWSLSAWMYAKRKPLAMLAMKDGTFSNLCGHTGPTPIEAIAAVVRRVAATPPAR